MSRHIPSFSLNVSSIFPPCCSCSCCSFLYDIHSSISHELTVFILSRLPCHLCWDTGVKMHRSPVGMLSTVLLLVPNVFCFLSYSDLCFSFLSGCKSIKSRVLAHKFGKRISVIWLLKPKKNFRTLSKGVIWVYK